jgi:ectoine hydroxylase-related dioxygenase (phytanoyl-CoA dioxygenase family)
VAAEPADDAAALQAKVAEHGHVFVPGALPAEQVLEARAEALTLLRKAGWVAPGGPYEARWSGVKPSPLESDPEWLAFYTEWINQPAFNSLPEHPALIGIAERILGGEVMVHRRKIGRVGFPENDGHQTPVHQDFFHVRGTAETYTMWVPLGDCPQTLGCVSIADGTHTLGFTEHSPSAGPGGWAVEPGSHAIWRSQDFEAGDVVVFHSLTMHRALPNRTQDEVRVSLDNRYQRAGDEIDPSSLKQHL